MAARNLALVMVQYGARALGIACGDEDETDSECDEDRAEVQGRRKVAKVLGYAEELVPAMTETLFRRHFRLTRTTFDWLMNHVGPLLPVPGN